MKKRKGPIDNRCPRSLPGSFSLLKVFLAGHRPCRILTSHHSVFHRPSSINPGIIPACSGLWCRGKIKSNVPWSQSQWSVQSDSPQTIPTHESISHLIKFKCLDMLHPVIHLKERRALRFQVDAAYVDTLIRDYVYDQIRLSFSDGPSKGGWPPAYSMWMKGASRKDRQMFQIIIHAALQDRSTKSAAEPKFTAIEYPQHQTIAGRQQRRCPSPNELALGQSQPSGDDAGVIGPGSPGIHGRYVHTFTPVDQALRVQLGKPLSRRWATMTHPVDNREMCKVYNVPSPN